MGLRCLHCGQELLGVVNTCWRCGSPVVPINLSAPPASLPPASDPPPANAPSPIESPARETPAAVTAADGKSAYLAPQARAPSSTPLASAGASAAEIADWILGKPSDEHLAPSQPAVALAPSLGDAPGGLNAPGVHCVAGLDPSAAEAAAPASTPRENDEPIVAEIVAAAAVHAARRGSPFAAARADSLSPARPTDAAKPSRLSEQLPALAYPTHPNAVAGAYGAVALGAMGLSFAFFPPGGLLAGFLGALYGLWGLISDRRRWALVGLLLSLAAIGLSLAVAITRALPANNPAVAPANIYE